MSSLCPYVHHRWCTTIAGALFKQRMMNVVGLVFGAALVLAAFLMWVIEDWNDRFGDTNLGLIGGLGLHLLRLGAFAGGMYLIATSI